VRILPPKGMEQYGDHAGEVLECEPLRKLVYTWNSEDKPELARAFWRQGKRSPSGRSHHHAGIEGAWQRGGERGTAGKVRALVLLAKELASIDVGVTRPPHRWRRRRIRPQGVCGRRGDVGATRGIVETLRRLSEDGRPNWAGSRSV
jgi:hypothetical protein